MSDDRNDAEQDKPYSVGFLANSFTLTPKQAREILDRANGSRDAAAQQARPQRHKQP